MNRIPATLGAARQFSTSRAAQQHAITQSARGRWWGPAQATTGAVSSSSPVSPWATVVDTSNIMVSNLKTLESNPFAAAVSKQAPNRAATWSSSQRPRADAIRGARFEQTDLAAQPFAPSAEEMIAEEPIRLVHGNRASCDGGGGPLGHPKVFIPLDKPGEVFPCGYCGIRYKSDGSRAHH